jgi:hypothetical protein
MKSHVVNESQSREIEHRRLEFHDGAQDMIRAQIASDSRLRGHTVENRNLSHESEPALGISFGPLTGCTSGAKGFYCGYVAGGIASVVIAVLACIVLFLIGMLP